MKRNIIIGLFILIASGLSAQTFQSGALMQSQISGTQTTQTTPVYNSPLRTTATPSMSTTPVQLYSPSTGSSAMGYNTPMTISYGNTGSSSNGSTHRVKGISIRNYTDYGKNKPDNPQPGDTYTDENDDTWMWSESAGWIKQSGSTNQGDLGTSYSPIGSGIWVLLMLCMAWVMLRLRLVRKKGAEK